MCNLWHNLQVVEGGQYLVEVEICISREKRLWLLLKTYFASNLIKMDELTARYKCVRVGCTYEGSKVEAVHHFIREHVSLHTVPYYSRCVVIDVFTWDSCTIMSKIGNFTKHYHEEPKQMMWKVCVNLPLRIMLPGEPPMMVKLIWLW